MVSEQACQWAQSDVYQIYKKLDGNANVIDINMQMNEHVKGKSAEQALSNLETNLAYSNDDVDPSSSVFWLVLS